METQKNGTELSPAEEKALLRLTIIFVVLLVVVLTAVSIVIWNQNPLIMWVPAAILEWAFAGGMVAVLYRLAYRKEIRTVGMELYTWSIARPIIGLFMGSLVYFLALAGGKLLDTPPKALEKALWLNVVAFVGGFSDELSLGLIKQFVKRRFGSEEEEKKT